MVDQRSLPAVIGPTENALRALLRHVLAETSIRTYERWVALNLIGRAAGTPEEVRGALVDTLKIDGPRAEGILADLEDDDLTGKANDHVHLSTAGATALDVARSRVGAATARLTRSVSPASIDIALQVLDVLRSNAERELADAGK